MIVKGYEGKAAVYFQSCCEPTCLGSVVGVFKDVLEGHLWICHAPMLHVGNDPFFSVFRYVGSFCANLRREGLSCHLCAKVFLIVSLLREGCDTRVPFPLLWDICTQAQGSPGMVQVILLCDNKGIHGNMRMWVVGGFFFFACLFVCLFF